MLDTTREIDKKAYEILQTKSIDKIRPGQCNPYTEQQIVKAAREIQEKRKQRSGNAINEKARLKSFLFRRIQARLTEKLKAQYPYRKLKKTEFTAWVSLTGQSGLMALRLGKTMAVNLCLKPGEEFTTINGKIVIYNKKKITPCKWYEQKGFQLHEKTGYFIDRELIPSFL